MCTLTIHASDTRCLITMNRDEQRQRIEPGVLMNPSNSIFPLDNESGGTWMGVNNSGVILSLLNLYQAKSITPSATLPKSRGLIIPEALKTGHSTKVKAFLKNLPYKEFKPFNLVLISSTEIVRFEWDGLQFSHQEITTRPWYMLTSSSVNAEQTLAYRNQLFETWTAQHLDTKPSTTEIRKGFHLKQSSEQKSASILMEREHSHTKSITQVLLSPNTLTLDYYPEIYRKPNQNPLSQSIEVSH